MSDLAEIAKQKIPPNSSFKHVTKVLQVVLNNINKSFETFIDSITETYCSGRRLKQEEERWKMFHVITEKEGGMFPAFKIKIFQELLNIRTYEFNRSTTSITTSDVMIFFLKNMNSSSADMFEVYFFNLNTKEEVQPKPVKTHFAECFELLNTSKEYKFVLSATDVDFVSWYKKETVLIYLRELRWHLLCLDNKLNFHVQIFCQMCSMIMNENSNFKKKINIGVYAMSDLFFSIHNDCSYFVETDEPPNDALQFTYNGTANCFQHLLNIIQKVFLL
jgi:hypothetical protein